jgi:hypothetical protein
MGTKVITFKGPKKEQDDQKTEDPLHPAANSEIKKTPAAVCRQGC